MARDGNEDGVGLLPGEHDLSDPTRTTSSSADYLDHPNSDLSSSSGTLCGRADDESNLAAGEGNGLDVVVRGEGWGEVEGGEDGGEERGEEVNVRGLGLKEERVRGESHG
jgi:hypothetical protein